MKEACDDEGNEATMMRIVMTMVMMATTLVAAIVLLI
jgi:hypothetical protein